MDTGKRKRIRRDPDTTKTLILDVADRLMVDEGYASVTSRRIAQELGINGATVHYYYPTTDDLFIAVHKRLMERQVAEISKVLTSKKPLEALWKFQSGYSQSGLGVEFLTVANHRKSISERTAGVTNEARESQARLLQPILSELGIDPKILHPRALAVVLLAISRTLANEERVGITNGHKEVRTFVKWALNNLLQTKN